MSDLQKYFNAQIDEMVAELRRLVELESPTRDKAAVDTLIALIAERTRALGATVTLDRQTKCGDHVVARWEGAATRRQLLILCHLDTVWSLGALAEQPLRVEDGRLYGPGSYDMRAGVVITLTVLEGLRALGLWPERPLTALFTSDEELSSRTSRVLIEREAQRSDQVLVLEPVLCRALDVTSLVYLAFGWHRGDVSNGCTSYSSPLQ
jgi:glutamate carboxypeptidase